MIRSESRAIDPPGPPSHPESFASGAVWQPWNISRRQREARNRHQACVLWFTGLSGSGNPPSLAPLNPGCMRAAARPCCSMAISCAMAYAAILAFHPLTAWKHPPRRPRWRACFLNTAIWFCAPLFLLSGGIATGFGNSSAPIASLKFLLDCPLEVCRQRDTKGLYARAAAGQIRNLTGMGQEYEPPLQPALVLPTAESTPEVLVEKFMQWLEDQNIFHV